MELFFNFLFSILEHFSQDGYKVLLCISFVFLVYKYWYLFIKEKILLLSLIFVLYGFLLSLFCSDTESAVKGMLDLSYGWVLALFLGHTLINENNKIKVLNVTFFVFAFLVFIGLFSYFGFLPEKYWGLRFAYENQLRIFTHRVPFAARCELMLMVSITLLLFKKNLNKRYTLFLSIVTFFFLLGIILSGSRIYYGVTGIMLFLILGFYYYKTRALKICLTITAIFILSIFIAYITNPELSRRIHKTSITKDISISSRVNMHKYGISVFKQHPIFGVGPAQATLMEEFSKVKMDKPHWHLHSIYLELLANFGIVGLLLFLSIVFSILISLITEYLKDGSALKLAMIFAWFAVLIGDYADAVLENAFISSLYFWLTGLALSKPKEEFYNIKKETLSI